MGEGLVVDIPHSKSLEDFTSSSTRRSLKLDNYQTTGVLEVKHPLTRLSGDYIGKVLPVPIPNTAVKLFEPMIVHTSVKVGIAGFLKNLSVKTERFFFAYIPFLAPIRNEGNRQ